MLKVGDYIRNINSDKYYTVVFCYDTLTFGLLEDDNETFEHMSEWLEDEWEVIESED